MGRIIRSKHGPEWHAQEEFREYLVIRDWLVERMIGNAYQMGIPDLYAWRPDVGQRWIDMKVKGAYSFTQAQKIKWRKWEKYKLGVWIITAATQEEYDKLFQPPNFRDYWKPSWDKIPDIEELLKDVDRNDS